MKQTEDSRPPDLLHSVITDIVHDEVDNVLDKKIDGIALKVAQELHRLMSGKKVYAPDAKLNTPKAAEVLDKTPPTLRNWREKGEGVLYHKYPSGEVYYIYSELQAYLNQSKVIAPLRKRS